MPIKTRGGTGHRYAGSDSSGHYPFYDDATLDQIEYDEESGPNDFYAELYEGQWRVDDLDAEGDA